MRSRNEQGNPFASVSAPPRVMVVDDEADLVFILVELLERCGFEVIPSTPQGEEFKGLMEGKGPFPDVILLDQNLGRLVKGLSTARKLRDVHPEAVIVLMSGNEIDLAQAPWIDLFSLKPFKIEQLVEGINARLAARKLAAGRASAGDAGTASDAG